MAVFLLAITISSCYLTGSCSAAGGYSMLREAVDGGVFYWTKVAVDTFLRVEHRAHSSIFTPGRKAMSMDATGLTRIYQSIPNTIVQLPFFRTCGSIKSRRER